MTEEKNVEGDWWYGIVYADNYDYILSGEDAQMHMEPEDLGHRKIFEYFQSVFNLPNPFEHAGGLIEFLEKIDLPYKKYENWKRGKVVDVKKNSFYFEFSNYDPVSRTKVRGEPEIILFAGDIEKPSDEASILDDMRMRIALMKSLSRKSLDEYVINYIAENLQKYADSIRAKYTSSENLQKDIDLKLGSKEFEIRHMREYIKPFFDFDVSKIYLHKIDADRPQELDREETEYYQNLDAIGRAAEIAARMKVKHATENYRAMIKEKISNI